jgi:hypothetical protein
MMQIPVIRFDNTAIGRARRLRAEARALRHQSRALIRRIHANHPVIRGISNPMLMEISYDLTALGLHDLSVLCHTVAEGIADERVAGDPGLNTCASRRHSRRRSLGGRPLSSPILPRGPAAVGGRAPPQRLDPAEYRTRAQAWRQKAALLFDQRAEQVLCLRLADGYEKLATQIEQLTRRSTRTSSPLPRRPEVRPAPF